MSTMPLGNPEIVNCRSRIVASMPCPSNLPFTPRPCPYTVHINLPFHSYSNACIYIGHGKTDCQSRPSPWSNPYIFVEYSRRDAFEKFRKYLQTRADLPEFLSHLEGKQMVCDCPNDEWCHGLILTDAFRSTFSDVETCTDNKYNAFCAECVMEDFDDDEEEDAPCDLAPAPKFIDEIERVNEIVRSNVVDV